VLFLHNTSRVDDEPYPTLLQDKGFGGFPSVCFMDADGNVLAKPGRSVAAFRETHTQAKALAALRGKTNRTPAEDKELFLTELKLDLVPVGEIQARADKVADLSKDEQALVAQKIVDGEVMALLRDARKAGPEATSEKLLALAKAGRTPSDAMGGMFWQQVLSGASAQKDAEMAQQAYDNLMRIFGKEKGERFEKAKEAWQKQVEEAKAK
jgi:hypothetical protein